VELLFPSANFGFMTVWYKLYKDNEAFIGV